MECVEFGVFKKGTGLYKQFLDKDAVEEIMEYVNKAEKISHDGSLAKRHMIKEVPQELKDLIKKRIYTALDKQYNDLIVSDEMRIYVQEYGATKEHRDVSYDGKSNLTCLLYFTDDYDGGELKYKVKRTDLSVEPEKKHNVITIKPKNGYGIVFKKEFLHSAEEVFGKKCIMLVDLFTDFFDY